MCWLVLAARFWWVFDSLCTGSNDDCTHTLHLGCSRWRVPSRSFLCPFTAISPRSHARSYEVEEEYPQGRAVSFTTREIEFRFARKEEISRFQPILRGLSERVKDLSREEQKLNNKLEDLKMAYPPVHYLKLRQVERELADKQEEIEALKRKKVRFRGMLRIRLIGERR